MIYPPSATGLNLTAVKWSVILLAVVAMLLAAYSHGSHVRDGELAKVERDTALAYAGEIVARQQSADHLAEQNAALRAAQASRDRIITKEIVKYEFIAPPGLRCTLPGAFRLLHDAAATGQDPAAETGSLAAGNAQPVDDATLLRTIGHNYAACRNAIAQVEGWQRRYHALEATDEKSR